MAETEGEVSNLICATLAEWELELKHCESKHPGLLP